MAEDAEKTARSTTASKETSLVHVVMGKQLNTVQMDREHVLCEQPCTLHTKMDYCILSVTCLWYLESARRNAFGTRLNSANHPNRRKINQPS